MLQKRHAAAVALALCAVASRASAYTVSTPVTDGCHEQITQAALRAARAATPLAAPLPLATDNDQALADDLPFDPASDMGDLGAISLLLGVRDNDLKGLSPTDLAALAVIQSDPSTQDEHCLRSLSEDEPNGTPQALAACSAYILAHVESAVSFVDSTGAPDPNARMELTVGLGIRGPVTASLPGFYVNMGQALHALEDGYSHSYRSEDGGVTEALTWLHVVDNDLNQAVDGPPHSSGLDECTSLDEFRSARLSTAEESSTELLLAALGPGSSATRLANASSVVAQVLAYQPGCTYANGWCDAPERAYPVELYSCSSSPRSSRGPGGVCAVLGCALALCLLRRRSRALAIAASTFLWPVPAALASDAPADAAPCPTPAPPAGAAEAPNEPASTSRFGAYAAAGGALDHSAFAGSVAARVRLVPRWVVGVDAEINPWFSVLDSNGVRPGALNVYGTVIRRWSVFRGPVDIRSTAHLGTSTILFDLYGVPRYTTGIYVGANLVGVEWRVARSVSLVLDPADVAFPIPQLRATPFGYLQYRLTIGMQWGA